MPRVQRLEDVTCAICMESLFNKRDDLDEPIPIATPDCGHVFHETCLFEWFRTQSLQYLNQAREQGIRFRGGSPSFSDAPNECPTCRTECFADPETGEPSVHRLFIHFGEGEGAAPSSQAGSSPVKWRGTQGKGKEREVMGLARRAKGLREEVNGLGGDSESAEVEGMIRRVESLSEDAVSAKALSGMKTYFGGLITAINNLRTSLETYPLSATLTIQLQELIARNDQLKHHEEKLLRVQFPRELTQAIAKEREKAERRLRVVREECDLIKRELEREQVASRVQRTAMEEREREGEKRITEIKATLAGEQANRDSLSTRLNDRTKSLKLLQSKVDSRLKLKSQIDTLQAENTRLKAELANHSSQSGSPAKFSYPQRERRSSFLSGILDDLVDDNDTTADLSVQEIPQSVFAASQPKSPLPRQSHDDSLLVEMPDKLAFNRAESSQLRLEDRSHPTARTFSFDLEEPGTKRKSKYFPALRDRDANEDRILEASLSPSPPKRNRTNPFPTTREASDKRKVLKMATTDSPIDLISPSKPLAQVHDRNLPENSGSVVDWLGITDASGRPRKGVVGGVKVKRRL